MKRHAFVRWFAGTVWVAVTLLSASTPSSIAAGPPSVYVADWGAWYKHPPPEEFERQGSLYRLSLDGSNHVSSRTRVGDIGLAPVGIDVSADGRWVLVSARNSSDLRIFDMKGPPGSPVAHCKLTGQPYGIALVERPKSPLVIVAATDGILWAPFAGAQTCRKLRAVDGTEPAGRWALSLPAMIAVSPSKRTAYVTDYRSNGLLEIDLTTPSPTVRRPIEISGAGNGLTVGPDGRYLYVPIHNRNVLQIVDLSCESFRPSCYRELPTEDYPISTAVSRDGRHVFVVNNRISALPGNTRKPGSLTVISTGPTLEAHQTVSLVSPVVFGDSPEGITIQPCTGELFVTHRDDPKGWLLILKFDANKRSFSHLRIENMGRAGAQSRFIQSNCSK